jgi:hypothetical protein
MPNTSSKPVIPEEKKKGVYKNFISGVKTVTYKQNILILLGNFSMFC